MPGQYSDEAWKERQAVGDAKWRAWKQRQAGPAPQQRPSMVPADIALCRPYGQVRRALYGGWWTFVAAILFVGGLAALVSSVGTAFVGLALGALSGRYAYRIWTWRARSLWFVIFF